VKLAAFLVLNETSKNVIRVYPNSNTG